VTYSVRWPIRGAKADPVADDFFRTLGHLVGEALDNEAPLSLPNSDDPVVAAATAYTREHLSSITIGELCDAVGVSERTLRRRFDKHLHMTWRSYLLRARLLRAMAMLAEPNRSVIDVAIDVGFESASAFARSFGRHAGESPSSYRRRVAVS